MYNRYHDNNSVAYNILWIIIAFILFFGVRSCNITESRSTRNMTSIKEGYVYDTNTKIIYIESFTGRYSTEATYTAYYDENGNMCRYLDGKWVPIRKE